MRAEKIIFLSFLVSTTPRLELIYKPIVKH